MYRMCNFLIFMCYWFRNLCEATACKCYNVVKTYYTENNTMIDNILSVTSTLFSGHHTKDTKCDGIIPCACIFIVAIIIVFVVYYFLAYILELTFLLCVGILIAICFFIKTIVLSLLKSMLCHCKPNLNADMKIVKDVDVDVEDVLHVLPVLPVLPVFVVVVVVVVDDNNNQNQNQNPNPNTYPKITIL